MEKTRLQVKRCNFNMPIIYGFLCMSYFNNYRSNSTKVIKLSPSFKRYAVRYVKMMSVQLKRKGLYERRKKQRIKRLESNLNTRKKKGPYFLEAGKQPLKEHITHIKSVSPCSQFENVWLNIDIAWRQEIEVLSYTIITEGVACCWSSNNKKHIKYFMNDLRNAEVFSKFELQPLLLVNKESGN